jgi:DNA-directed RNA polymerase specialized sigma24 family protein
MVTQDQIETIQKVANKVARKYVFGFHDLDDIKQEAMIIGLHAVEKIWDGIRPLENFLSVHIPNRLKNFKRKNYFRLDIPQDNQRRLLRNETKRNLMEPTQLFDFDLMTSHSILDKLGDEEMLASMELLMPPFLKSDLRRIQNNVTISKKRKLEVLQYVKTFHENW